MDCILKKNEVFFKYVGSKRNVAEEIISMFPKHKVYCEVFGGAGNVLLRKPTSKLEVYNDINDDIANLFFVVRDYFKEFRRRVEFIPYSRSIYKQLKNETPTDNIDKAVRFFYLICKSFGGKCDFTFASRRDYVPSFNLKKIYKISKRLKNVLIENKNYSDIITYFDSDDTLFYLDPSYIGCNNKSHYANNHYIDYNEMIDQLKDIKGKFILSMSNNDYMKDLCQCFKIKEINQRYGIDQNRNNHKVKELIIANFEV